LGTIFKHNAGLVPALLFPEAADVVVAAIGRGPPGHPTFGPIAKSGVRGIW